MAELIDVMVYLLKHYPFKAELSNARLTKMVYLSDWKYALQHGQQMTSIEWLFNNFGPFVKDIENTALSHPQLFKIQETINAYGNKKNLIKYIDNRYNERISENEKKTLDFVINSTKSLDWDKFIQLVYSTYPILLSERHSKLDLVALAGKRNAEKERAHPILQ